jgi:hypothetical protein
LTNFNVENQCTPSRAALMTGRLPIRSGIGKAIAAGAPGGLHPWEITIPKMLGEAGYRTAIFGKWHLGAGEGRLPTDQGFDEWFGFETSDIVYWAGKPDMPVKDVHFIREARKGERPRNLRVYDEDMRRQIDRMVTDRAVDYIASNGGRDRPFFLYASFAFAHHPALAHPDFKGTSVAGEFGDSLLEHDHNVGRILDAVADADIAENTIVVWASDNGPSPLATVTPWWTIGDTGPWRGEIGTVGTGDWSSGSRRSVTCSAARGIAVRHTGNGTSARAADAGPQTRASPSGMGLPGSTTRHCGRLIRGMTRAAIRCQRCCPSSAAKQMSQKVNNSPSTSGATATTSISPKRTGSFGPR